MEKENILSYVDHTLLTQTATWSEIKEIKRFINIRTIYSPNSVNVICFLCPSKVLRIRELKRNQRG